MVAVVSEGGGDALRLKAEQVRKQTDAKQLGLLQDEPVRAAVNNSHMSGQMEIGGQSDVESESSLKLKVSINLEKQKSLKAL